MGQRIWVSCLRWLHPEALTKEQIVEAVMVEHYTAIFPFKPKNWVLYHQLRTLEEAITLMEVYVFTMAGHYPDAKNLEKDYHLLAGNSKLCGQAS